MAISDILKICYLLGSLSFIVGLKMLSRPDSAKKGNLFAAFGMAIAIAGKICPPVPPPAMMMRFPIELCFCHFRQLWLFRLLNISRYTQYYTDG